MELLFLNDISQLVLPVSELNPTGRDLRLQTDSQGLYQQMKDARFSARTAESQQAQGTEMARGLGEWQTVFKLGCEILITQSKDLEVCAWITEALLRLNGFKGLKDGFCLLRELIERYWDNLYPCIDEDGISTKIAPLIGLNGLETDGTLIVPIAMIPLTEGRSVEPFALWQYQTGKFSDAIKLAGRETSPLFFYQLRETLLACKEEFNQLHQVLESYCGDDSPPSSRIRRQLNACLECIDLIACDELIEKMDESTMIFEEAGTVSEKVVAGQASREQILQNLLQAAAFFRRTEPHSPLSYSLERIVRWGRMGLPELLNELVSDEQARGQIHQFTGIENP